MKKLLIILLVPLLFSCNKFVVTHIWENSMIKQKYIPIDNDSKFIKYYRAKAIEKYIEKWNNRDIEVYHAYTYPAIELNSIRFNELTGNVYLKILLADSIKFKHGKLLINTMNHE